VKILTTLLFLLSLNICLGQEYFDLAKEYPCENCADYSVNLNTIKKYDLKKANAILDSILDSEIEFNYIQGGCQHRAHIMSIILNRLSIEHFKVWLFAPKNLYKEDLRSLVIKDKNDLADNSKINWGYHVAPAILVKEGEETTTYILDPSINRKAIKLSDWFAAIEYKEGSKYTFLKPQFWSFLTENYGKTITGEFYKYTIDNRYCGDNYRNLSLEKGLAINDMAIYIYNKYIIKLKDSSDIDKKQKYSELKKVFGNVDVLTSFFSDLKSYCGKTVEDNISFRKFYQENKRLSEDAMSFYINRLNYWTIYTSNQN